MGSKKYHNEAWLQEKYHGERKTMQEIGDLCGVTKTTIGEWMDRHGIKKRDRREAQLPEGKHTNREWLAEQYHGKKRTLSDMADECDVNPVTIMNWMDRYDIPRRDDTYHKRVSPAYFLTDHEGYERISSKANGQARYAKVHQLVAIANGANPHKLFGEDYHVHHRNEVPWDNRPKNLEVLSNSEHKRLHSRDRERAATGEFL